MAKSRLKTTGTIKAKRAIKKVESKSARTGERFSSDASSAKSHIESLSQKRRDAAIVWGVIKNGNHSIDEIKTICKEKGFDTLLGEI